MWRFSDYRNHGFLLLSIFLLQGCCGFFKACPPPTDRCAEQEKVAQDMGKRILATKESPNLTMDDARLVIMPFKPDFGKDADSCSYAFEPLLGISQKVLKARDAEMSEILTTMCAQQIEEDDHDVSAGAAIVEQRTSARHALEYLRRPTQSCINGKQ